MLFSKFLAAPCIACLCAVAAPVSAHIDWSRVNAIDPDCLALYHMTGASANAGDLIMVVPGLPDDRSLTIQAAAGTPAVLSTSIAKSIFGPNSLRFHSVQVAVSTATVGQFPGPSITGDLSIETYFKWHAGMLHSTFIVGFENGPKLQVTYDSTNHANDRLGILTALGDFRPAPGFTNWTEAPEDDAGIEIWGHAGFCITSTGTSFDGVRGTHAYNPGSVARFYISSHLVGTFPAALDISGMATETASRIVMQCTAGSHLSLDEFTIWNKDWSENGVNFSPFANGRGSGQASVSRWELY